MQLSMHVPPAVAAVLPTGDLFNFCGRFGFIMNPFTNRCGAQQALMRLADPTSQCNWPSSGTRSLTSPPVAAPPSGATLIKGTWAPGHDLVQRSGRHPSYHCRDHSRKPHGSLRLQARLQARSFPLSRCLSRCLCRAGNDPASSLRLRLRSDGAATQRICRGKCALLTLWPCWALHWSAGSHPPQQRASKQTNVTCRQLREEVCSPSP